MIHFSYVTYISNSVDYSQENENFLTLKMREELVEKSVKIQSELEFMNIMALKRAALWIGSMATAGNKQNKTLYRPK